ncbi:phasin family protein [Sphingomonas quercus]|nr:TIGR01841 family phasin [Sphingomonas quercus]
MATTPNPTFTAENTAEKFQTAFTDVQGRTKAALEKSAKFYEELGDFTKGNIEAVIASSKVAASAAETLGQDAAAFGKKNLEQATATFKSLAAAKSPTELLQLHSDYARAAFDAMVAESSRVSEKLVKLAGEIAQPLSSRFAVAAEKVKATSL